VRAHERAHATTGGDLAGSPSFEFTQGPDGKRYATAGEVPIDSGPVRGNPTATVRKMDIVIRAALAPTNPSSQDQQVARQAQQARTQAQAELTNTRLAENQSGGEEASSGPESATNDQPSSARQLQARSVYGQSGTGGEEDIATRIFAAANALSVFA
jgi:SprA family protein